MEHFQPEEQGKRHNIVHAAVGVTRCLAANSGERKTVPAGSAMRDGGVEGDADEMV